MIRLIRSSCTTRENHDDDAVKVDTDFYLCRDFHFWRTHKIPDRWNAGILLVAVLLALVDPSVSWQERILGMFAVSVPMACLLFFVPGSFGGGDIKFVAAVGAAIGVKLVVMGSAAAILLAGIYCIRLLAEKRNGQKTAFAFGPFLCMGMTAAMVFGDAWAAWFLSG